MGALLAEQVVMTAERLSLLDSRFIFRCHFFGIGIALGSCSERGKLFLLNANLFLAALCRVYTNRDQQSIIERRQQRE